MIFLYYQTNFRASSSQRFKVSGFFVRYEPLKNFTLPSFFVQNIFIIFVYLKVKFVSSPNMMMSRFIEQCEDHLYVVKRVKAQKINFSGTPQVILLTYVSN